MECLLCYSSNSNDYGELILSPITEQSFGCYQCVVSSGQKKVYSDIVNVVKGFPIDSMFLSFL